MHIYIYLCIYIYTRVHLHIYICICKYKHTFTHTRTCIYGFKIPHIVSWSHLQSYDPELLETHPFPTHSRGNSPSNRQT